MQPRRDDAHYSGTLTALLLEHADRVLGEGGADRVRHLAEEHRPDAELRAPATWSSYARFRRLAEATASLTGDLAAAGRGIWDGAGSAVRELGSPDAVLELIGALASEHERLIVTIGRRVGEGDWRVTRRFLDGYDPFPESCALARGLLGHVPVVFGLAAGEAVEEACRCRGDAQCTFVVRWDPGVLSSEAGALARLAVRARVLEARLEGIEDTVGELVSGDSLDVVLERIVTAAARALPGQAVVLALEPAEGAERRVHWRNLGGAEARACADAQLDAGGPGEPWVAVAVESRRARYGSLAAADLLGEPDGHHDRLVLGAYGRLAAAALDSACVLGEARRQADVASELLRLSQSLAEIGTTQEVAQRLAEAVPSLIDCDQVVISTYDAGAGLAHVVAAHGYGEEADRRIEGGAVPVDESFTDLHVVRALRRGDDLDAVERRLLGGAEALATVPLHAGGEVLGWVAAIVQHDASRLLDDPHLPERLRGLAGQGATALRNARLVDRMRHEADHDPLTGLANQRLLEVHATHALARARRDRSRVGLLFLDLDDFKDVNDTLGHAEGDLLLQQVTGRLQAALREVDTVARFGGDEFVVLLPGLTDDGAAVVSKIGLAMTEAFLVGGSDVHVSTSVGTAIFPDDGDDFGELLKRADIRMYEQKLRRRQPRRSST